MTTWNLYFASLVSMSLHPGYLRPDTEKPTLHELAQLADQMLYFTPEERQCQ